MAGKYDNSGIVYVNERKEKDSHPDRTGYCTIGGVEYWISGWLKKGDKGPFLSLAFKRKETKEDKPRRQDRGRAEDIESDIPW
jgi:hypothetical protein